MSHDTIFAQCSKPGKCGVNIFRISGPHSINILHELSGHKKITPRYMHYTKLWTHNKDIIDKAMVCYFKGPESFTGDDVVEIYTHGSIAIAKMLTEAVLRQEYVRLAEPGEFSKRAFLNNKMSLTEAEGLQDLINAETLMQQRQAVRQMNGALELLYQDWRLQLLKIMALLEAYLDFPDEDIPDELIKDVEDKVTKITHLITLHLNDNNRGQKLKEGIELVIFGPPNVGKSSLINYLMKQEIAIVSNVAGTTRDVISAHLDIGGYPIILKDTAGIRQETSDAIEKEGIARALQAASNADIKILMLDNANIDNLAIGVEQFLDDNTIILVNKLDLSNPLPKEIWGRQFLSISLLEQTNVNQILSLIEEIASTIASPGNSPAITQVRYRINIEKALAHLKRFNLQNELVLAAEDIRLAIRGLEFIIGKVDVDEILGEIFSSFCIGK